MFPTLAQALTLLANKRGEVNKSENELDIKAGIFD